MKLNRKNLALLCGAIGAAATALAGYLTSNQPLMVGVALVATAVAGYLQPKAPE